MVFAETTDPGREFRIGKKGGGVAALTLRIAKPWLVRDFALFLVALDNMYNKFRLFDDMLTYREKPPSDFLHYLQSADAEAERRFPEERLTIAKIVIQSDGLVKLEDGGEIIKEMRETIQYILYGWRYDKRLKEIEVKKKEVELRQQSEKGDIELEKERVELGKKEAEMLIVKIEADKRFLENLSRKKQYLKENGYSEEDIRKIIAVAMAPNEDIRRFIKRGKIVEVLGDAKEEVGEVVDKE